MSYILGDDAVFDLEPSGHLGLHRRDNIDAVDRWIAKLFETFDALGQTPGMGHKREDLTRFPVLFWPVGAYLVIYRAERSPIEIVAVTQGSRDIPGFLNPRMH